MMILFVSGVRAQDNLTGRIYEAKTKVMLPGIIVKNLKTQSTTISDHTGAYSIPAHIGDLVVFSAFSYVPDTLYVTSLKYTEISLVLKSNMLNEVRVTGQETRLGNLKAAPTLSPINSQALTYSTDSKGNYTGGLTAHIFDSHSAENKRKHEAQVTKDEAIKNKIAEIFSPKGLKDYIPLEGQEMQNFIVTYTPDIKTYTDPNFNLTTYINDSYQEFLKIPESERKSKTFQQILKPADQ
ncbi:hypothetical protein [Mucilaginibacter ginsenosidivorans]|uniref:Carboxypeptidase-like regulatory domain-containing protein n=1 Tax=Mucilaginibacter ginsenosidivorans TaxID=398053 RepID=A0A5B8V2M3_9SPHI|nr:hypothetical protein [Mucilaginibacter ginsenosidivorans]QEC65325.1 hypothetical protein FRZ54_23040 [Mucilaginibacter ginsenosidivorans]